MTTELGNKELLDKIFELAKEKKKRKPKDMSTMSEEQIQRMRDNLAKGRAKRHENLKKKKEGTTVKEEKEPLLEGESREEEPEPVTKRPKPKRGVPSPHDGYHKELEEHRRGGPGTPEDDIMDEIRELKASLRNLTAKNDIKELKGKIKDLQKQSEGEPDTDKIVREPEQIIPRIRRMGTRRELK